MRLFERRHGPDLKIRCQSSPKKTPKKKKQQDDAETVKETVTEDSKAEEEVDGEDEGDQKLSLLVLDDPVLKEFQAIYPEDFKVIIQLFIDPSAIKIVIEAYRDYDDQPDFGICCVQIPA